MYCTPKEFIDISLAQGADKKDVYTTLWIIRTLLQRRGVRLGTTMYMQALHAYDPSLSQMISLLSRLSMLQISSLTLLLTYVQDAQKPMFYVQTNKAVADITEFLQNTFGDIELTHIPSEHNELVVS